MFFIKIFPLIHIILNLFCIFALLLRGEIRDNKKARFRFSVSVNLDTSQKYVRITRIELT